MLVKVQPQKYYYRNHLLCEDIEFIIFPYGFHGERKQMFEQVLSRLRQDNIVFELCPVILKCDKEENIKRAVKKGRDKERIERGMKNTYAFYDTYTYPRIDTCEKSMLHVISPW